MAYMPSTHFTAYGRTPYGHVAKLYSDVRQVIKTHDVLMKLTKCLAAPDRSHEWCDDLEHELFGGRDDWWKFTALQAQLSAFCAVMEGLVVPYNGPDNSRFTRVGALLHHYGYQISGCDPNEWYWGYILQNVGYLMLRKF